MVFFFDQDIVKIQNQDLARLIDVAKKSPKRRARFCLHRDHSDLVQEMIIAFCQDSEVPIHKHTDKSESFHVIDGIIEVQFFNDSHEITESLKMGPIGSGLPFVYRLSGPKWHTVKIISEFAIIHETSSGPFVENDMEILDSTY